MGPFHHSHHHFQLSAQQTTKEVQDHHCHHLRRSQNTPLLPTNVQERLVHGRTNDEVQNADGCQQDLDAYPAVFHQTFCPAQGLRRQLCRQNRAHINNIPTNCSIVSTTNDITTHNLYIESLKESLAAVQGYVPKERTPAPGKPDPEALMRMELDA
jgi:hypothetical protein